MQKLCKEQELMKYSTKLSDAVHILAFIVLNPNGSLTSDSIAKSVHTTPECCVGVYIQLSLQDFFDQIQQKAEEEILLYLHLCSAGEHLEFLLFFLSFYPFPSFQFSSLNTHYS